MTLAPSSQGRGIATEALRALVAMLFGAHGMHRVFAQADDRNAPVHRLLERLGFRLEARLVEAGLVQGGVDHAARLCRARARVGMRRGGPASCRAWTPSPARRAPLSSITSPV